MGKNILLIILADPDCYPPTMHAANILAEKGYNVSLVGIKYSGLEPMKLDERVNKVYYDRHRKGVMNVVQYFSFYLWLFFRCIFKRPDHIICYDAMAVGPVAICAGLLNIKWGYHNHDLFTNPRGWYKLIKKLEVKFARKASFISFPQEDRADVFKQEASLSEEPVIMYNAPRLSWVQNRNEPLPVIAGIKKRYRFLVLYQGQFSRYFNLDKLIEALSLLGNDYALCIRGRELEKGYLNELLQLAKKTGVSERVFPLPPQEYNDLPAITKFCDLGVAKLASSLDVPLNDYYLTGASNKISEYMACGLPILMSDTPVNRSFFGPYGVGVFCDGNDPASIASAIKGTLENTEALTNLRHNHQQLSKSVFNYDVQFKKILEYL